MKRFVELNAQERERAAEVAQTDFLERVVEGRLRPTEPDLVARVTAAMGDAERLKTPWFAGELLLEDAAVAAWVNRCVQAQLQVAWFPAPGELVLEGVCARDAGPAGEAWPPPSTPPAAMPA